MTGIDEKDENEFINKMLYASKKMAEEFLSDEFLSTLEIPSDPKELELFITRVFTTAFCTGVGWGRSAQMRMEGRSKK